ncbi:hypothetical protein JTE90_029442 [Oedothorax gibbosus]|uniref:Uncharacterized protein n=1 Tax=Oedothorax gibbosus TaxID=931172 RepID=A0AAV6U3M6_9ARAC|nr:hypothetical protein JTE90_029442 [Oedothorax gibbosus]
MAPQNHQRGPDPNKVYTTNSSEPNYVTEKDPSQNHDHRSPFPATSTKIKPQKKSNDKVEKSSWTSEKISSAGYVMTAGGGKKSLSLSGCPSLVG